MEQPNVQTTYYLLGRNMALATLSFFQKIAFFLVKMKKLPATPPGSSFV
jgi:hypothetical protein